jgi:hypothetical protein
MLVTTADSEAPRNSLPEGRVGPACVTHFALAARRAVILRAQVAHRWVAHLTVTCFITLLLHASCVADPKTAFDDPTQQVEAALTRLVGCRWSVTSSAAVCPMPPTGGVLTLTNSLADQPETIEMNVLIAAKPQRDPVGERVAHDQTIAVIRYLLPTWAAARGWLSQALDAARQVHGRRTTKVGNLTVLVQWLQPADLDGTFATVVVTKRTSLAEWDWRDN